MCCIVDAAGYAALAYVGYRLTSVLYNVFYPFFISPGIADLKAYSGGEWAGLCLVLFLNLIYLFQVLTVFFYKCTHFTRLLACSFCEVFFTFIDLKLKK